MDSNVTLSRRTLIKTLGAGAAVAGLGLYSSAKAQAAGGLAVAGELRQPFTLSPLGFGYGALEPVIDARTMEIHHGKHHQGY
ncbi:MAG: twin-arginine translocation signal domain-containing protein, partial [Cephaloticoccus sp.]